MKYIEIPILLKFNTNNESEHILYNKLKTLNRHMLLTFDDSDEIVFGYLEVSNIVESQLPTEITSQLLVNTNLKRLDYYGYVLKQLMNFYAKKQVYKEIDIGVYKILKKLFKCWKYLLNGKQLKKRVTKLKKNLDQAAILYVRKNGHGSNLINKLKCLIGALEFFCIITVKKLPPRINNRKVVLYTNRILQRFIFLLQNFHIIKRT